jgi:uncharacterized membrane protein
MSGHKRMQYRAEHQGALAPKRQGEAKVNINQTERQLSLIGGSVLAVCGLLRGSASGLALAAIGGGLIYRGYTGHCHVYDAFEFSSAEGSERKELNRRQPETGADRPEPQPAD